MLANPYEYEETTIITQVGDANFKATGKVPTKQGWQALFDDHKADQQVAANLPLVHRGNQVKANLQTPQKETEVCQMVLKDSFYPLEISSCGRSFLLFY